MPQPGRGPVADGPAGAPDERVGEALFVSGLPHIEAAIRFACRRNGCRAEEAEEFAGHVRLKLIEDDYAVLRKFEGRSSLRTYLAIVVQRLMLDFRNARWGKWRPSAEARRLGDVALRLEALLYRDGHTLAEAGELLRGREGRKLGDGELHELARRLPVRQPRRHEPESALAELPAAGEGAEAFVRERERIERAREIRALLHREVEALPTEDRLILRLRFEQGSTMGDVARVVGGEAKPLYRRVERLLGSLRAALEAAGVRAEELPELVGTAWDAADPVVAGANRTGASVTN
jgi:RNA polymerase sigma factor for flagellar operon FliA